MITTKCEMAFGQPSDDQPAQPPQRVVIASKNLETGEAWLEVRVDGVLEEWIGYDDWDQAQVDAVRVLLGVAPGGGVKGV